MPLNINPVEIRPDAVDAYYKRIKASFEMSLRRTLGGKAESGSTRSEYGYQSIAATSAVQLARTLGANEDKTAALSMAAGLYFPKYGHKGLEIVKQYITENNIDLSPESMGADMIECYMVDVLDDRIITDFDTAIRDYYAGDYSIWELKIVRFIQDTIMEVKKAEPFYQGQPGDLLFDVMQEVKNQAETHGELIKSSILEKYSKQISTFDFPELIEAECAEVYRELDCFIQEFCNMTGDLARYNKTPEEAVLTYIYLHN